jgi:hypothetical protein
MDPLNPYIVAPGRELDLLVHVQVLRKSESDRIPPYSADDRLARQVENYLRTLSGAKIISGRSNLRTAKRWFARHEKDPSTGTEVLAETYPLAVCRLALLVGRMYHK